jgi:hypothetical protein
VRERAVAFEAVQLAQTTKKEKKGKLTTTQTANQFESFFLLSPLCLLAIVNSCWVELQ